MNFEKYRAYEVQEFLEDEDFRAWVYHPTPQSNRYWQGLLQQYPEKENTLKEARLLLEQMGRYFEAAEQVEASSDEAFRRRLRNTMEHSKARRRRKNQSRRLLRLAGAAAGALILGLLGWLFFLAPAPMQVYATDYGEWKTVQLPDSTIVELNSNSELRYAESWRPGEDRKVWLKGEAFFQVTKDPAGASFLVVTEELTVRVLGTSFNVHSREKQTEVFLEEGKVVLELDKEEKELAPGELIVYSAAKKAVTEIRKAPAELHTSWKDGSLRMEDKPVAEILEKIEEIYGLKPVVADTSLLRVRKTIGIPMDKIEVAAPILEITFNTDIEVKGNQLIIK